MIHVHDLLADHQKYHSSAQIDAFIVARNGGTPYGQYKQVLRELDARRNNLFTRYNERELLGIDIEDLEPCREVRRIQIEISQKEFQLQALEDTITDTEREFMRFYAHAVTLKTAIETEHGPFDEAVREKLDAAEWEWQMQEKCAIDILAQGRVSAGTIEMLRSWPNRKLTGPMFEAILENTPHSMGRLVCFITDSPPPLLPEWNGEVDGVEIKALLAAR